MQNMLEQGPDFWCWFDTTQFSYIPLCSPNTCKYVFNPNVTTFQSNCAEGLHFSAFIFYSFSLSVSLFHSCHVVVLRARDYSCILFLYTEIKNVSSLAGLFDRVREARVQSLDNYGLTTNPYHYISAYLQQ